MSHATAPATVRRARGEDLGPILDLLTEYGLPREYFAPYYTADPTFRPELCWLVEREGRLLAFLRIFDRVVRTSAAPLRVAGVGNVITTETERGKGHAGRLLRALDPALADEGFAYSLLWTHLPDLYARYGWAPIEQTRLRIFAPSPSDPNGDLARFTTADLSDVMKLYDAANASRSGTVVRTPGYWRGQLAWLNEDPSGFLLLRQGGRLAGYVRSRQGLGELELLELTVRENSPAAARSLVGALAAERRLPVQAVLPPSLRSAWRAEESAAEEEPGLMGRAIDLQALLVAVGPIWRDRANAAGAEGFFSCQTHAGSLQVTIRDGQLRVAPIVAGSQRPDDELGTVLDEGLLAHLLFHGWDSAVADLLGDSPGADLLRVIFPTQDFVIWPADAF